jgi:ribulose-5-phosphate 4-epimerase/fuculose-1-phosphate aldolase
MATTRQPALRVIDETDAVRRARVDLAAAHRMAAFDGLNEGTWNHFSVMVPGPAFRMLISPKACHWSRITASGLLLQGAAGEILEGEGPTNVSAFAIHAPIHRARADAVCVLHAHSPYAVALSMIENGELLMAEQNALGFAGAIAYDRVYGGFAEEEAEGERLVRVLGDKRVLFLGNHGVVVVGPSIAEAYTDLYMLERCCRVLILAMSTGRRISLVGDDIARLAAAQHVTNDYKHAHFAAMKELLDAREPDYAT